MRSRSSTDTIQAAPRAARRVDLLTTRFSARGRRCLRAIDRHGDDLNRVATMLTEDGDWAAELVVQAVVVCVADGDEPDLRELSRGVVIAWLGRDASHGPVARTFGTPATPSLLLAVRDLPYDQRALLALCRFGSHTYREAALVLGLPPSRAAVLLGHALRALRTVAPSSNELALTARHSA